MLCISEYKMYEIQLVTRFAKFDSSVWGRVRMSEKRVNPRSRQMRIRDWISRRCHRYCHFFGKSGWESELR